MKGQRRAHALVCPIAFVLEHRWHVVAVHGAQTKYRGNDDDNIMETMMKMKMNIEEEGGRRL